MYFAIYFAIYFTLLYSNKEWYRYIMLDWKGLGSVARVRKGLPTVCYRAD